MKVEYLFSDTEWVNLLKREALGNKGAFFFKGNSSSDYRFLMPLRAVYLSDRQLLYHQKLDCTFFSSYVLKHICSDTAPACWRTSFERMFDRYTNPIKHYDVTLVKSRVVVLSNLVQRSVVISKCFISTVSVCVILFFFFVFKKGQVELLLTGHRSKLFYVVRKQGALSIISLN